MAPGWAADAAVGAEVDSAAGAGAVGAEAVLAGSVAALSVAAVLGAAGKFCSELRL